MSGKPRLTRRQALQFLAGLGISGPLALELLAQVPGTISPEVLQSASLLVGQKFDAERLKTMSGSLQQYLDDLKIVRDLEIDDQIEPSAIFNAR